MAKATGETQPKTEKRARTRSRKRDENEEERGNALSLSTSDGVATLTIDMPGQKVNLLTPEVMLELAKLIERIAAKKGLRCLVIRSGKPGIFIAGADIKELARLSEGADAEGKSGSGQEVFNRLDDLPFPTVAVIDGAAAGGGLELALACDYRIATDNPRTRIGLPETGLGLLPGFGGTYRLPRLVGPAQALTMILSGSLIDGVKAAKVKLVDACYPTAFIEERTREFVSALLDGPGAADVRRRRKRRPMSLALLERNPIGRALIYRRARADLLRRTGGHYPAQLAALKVVKRTFGSSRAAALKAERAAFGRLAPTPESKNLIALYFAREAAKRLPPEPVQSRTAATRRTRSAPSSAAAPRSIRRAAVLGAGVMGGRIAWLFTKYDLPVVMKDIAWPAVQKGYASAHSVYRELERRKRYDRREINLKMHHLSGTLEYSSLMKPDVVVEAVVENLNVKRQVLAEVEREVDPRTLIVSNTSSLSIEEMASALKRPERFLGMHFFNPPNRMPLVEIIPASTTDPAAVRSIYQLALTLGKTPVVVKDCPGFLVNRLLLPYLNEAALMAGEGVDFQRIDRLIEEFGMPMGPFTLFDEIGIDVAIEVAAVLERAYSERIIPVPLFDAFRERPDLLGKKSGKGFYLYRDGKRLKANPEIAPLLRAARAGHRGSIADVDIVERPLLALLNEAARALEEGVAGSAQELDLALIFGIGFPPFRGGILRYADSLGLADVKARLERYAAEYGKRFAPAHLICDLAPTRRKLADFDPSVDRE